jgi:HPt (histidine-containing phosphotransfer) domain-containing protein
MTARHILNTAEGLERLMDDAGLYRQVLLRFRKDYQAAVAQMRQLLADGEREAAQRKAHSMKGAAGMIGAEELQHVAGVTEAALSAANTANNAATGAAASADDEASLATLQTTLDQLLRAIAAHVDGNASAGNAAGSSATGPGAAKTAVQTAAAPALHAEAHALIARLAKLLNDGNGEAIDVLEQSATMLAASLGEAVFQEVAAAAHEYDYEAALAALERFNPRLNA